jgi:hypothetical protein
MHFCPARTDMWRMERAGPYSIEQSSFAAISSSGLKRGESDLLRDSLD